MRNESTWEPGKYVHATVELGRRSGVAAAGLLESIENFGIQKAPF